VIGGVCSFSLPSSPTAEAGAISYLEAGAPCGATQTSFATANPATGIRGLAPTPGGLAAAAVRDGNTIYWLRATGSPDELFVPGGAAGTVPGAGCELVASPVGPYAAEPARDREPEAAVDPVRSDLGYAWVSGPAGTQLLRPPATIPCAPSAETAFVDVAARWSRGRHTVRVSRQDPTGSSRSVAVFTSSVADGNGSAPRLGACGDSTRLTYAVSTGHTTQRVSFTVRRQ
jgi:hypothetical protein